jgi:hypothetical protein
MKAAAHMQSSCIIANYQRWQRKQQQTKIVV